MLVLRLRHRKVGLIVMCLWDTLAYVRVSTVGASLRHSKVSLIVADLTSLVLGRIGGIAKLVALVLARGIAKLASS